MPSIIYPKKTPLEDIQPSRTVVARRNRKNEKKVLPTTETPKPLIDLSETTVPTSVTEPIVNPVTKPKPLIDLPDTHPDYKIPKHDPSKTKRDYSSLYVEDKEEEEKEKIKKRTAGGYKNKKEREKEADDVFDYQEDEKK